MNLIKVNTVPTIFNRMDNIIDRFFSNHAYNKMYGLQTMI